MPFIRIHSNNDYALYLNTEQVTSVYQDPNQHWYAATADGGDQPVSESEARLITGQVNHSIALGGPVTDPLPAAAPVGYGPELGG